LQSKAADNPLRGAELRRFYLTGWSQSCGYITRYVKSFETAAAHAYDGYLLAGGIHTVLPPLNRYESVRAVDSRDMRLEQAPAPVIELNTESEASNEWGLCGYSARRPDSDEPDFRYRYRDIAGGCHDAADTCAEYLSFDGDVAKATGQADGLRDDGLRRNNYHKYFAFHAALRDLCLWSELGIAPKSYERMRQTGGGEILKDAFGNSRGGLRTPLIDDPVCTYYNWSEFTDPKTGQTRVDFLAGHEENFSAAFLRELYHDLAHYRKLAELDADRLVADGQILAADRDDLVETAVNRAREAGLQ